MKAPWRSTPESAQPMNKRTLVIACVVLLVYIGTLLLANYRSQVELRAATLEKLRLDVENHAATVSYFLAERRNDLQTAVGDLELAGTFAGSASAAPGRAGQNASLVLADLIFRETLANKTLNGEPVYERIAFADSKGRLLVDIPVGDKALPPWEELPPGADGEVRMLLAGTGPAARIVLTAPYFSKGRYSGQVLATIAPNLLDHMLAADGRQIRRLHLVTDDGRPVTGNGGSRVQAAASLPENFNLPAGQFHFYEGRDRDTAIVSMMALGITVKHAPLQLVYCAPAADVHGGLAPWQLLLAAGCMATVILGAVGILMRVNTQNLLLKVRIDESNRQKDALMRQNYELASEVETRKSAVEQLKKQQRQLEEQALELQMSMERTYSLAYFDSLTGLPNRALCLDRMGQALTAAKRNQTKLAVLFLDLDRFKEINDSLGHANGDILLQSVAERLRSCVRDADTVARFGGDEFIVLLSTLRRENDVTTVARKVLKEMDVSFNLGGHEVSTSASIGIALYPEDGEDAQSLLKHADMAMYAAKDQGRNTFEFFSPGMDLDALQRRDMETGLRHALERGELFLVYQPQFDMASGKVHGFEALLRWRHPRKGVLLPRQFIPLAESTGLIHAIGEWVLRTASAQAKAWRSAGLENFRLAVNLSGRQLRQADLPVLIDRCLADSALPAEFLELELNEKVVADSAAETIQTLQHLKGLGVTISLDDFSSGYLSLDRLRELPVDRIKLDKRLLSDVAGNPDEAATIETLVAMAAELGIEVLADGVENRAQVDYLLQRRCRAMQGFYLCPPMEVAALTRNLLERSAETEERPSGAKGGGVIDGLWVGLKRDQVESCCVS